jgi:hypothetical protein
MPLFDNPFYSDEDCKNAGQKTLSCIPDTARDGDPFIVDRVKRRVENPLTIVPVSVLTNVMVLPSRVILASKCSVSFGARAGSQSATCPSVLTVKVPLSLTRLKIVPPYENDTRPVRISLAKKVSCPAA